MVAAMDQQQYVSYSAAWFTLSLINAGLAQAKGRSGLNWWLISLFLGPLATLLIVATERATATGRPAEGRMTQSQAIVLGAAILLVVLVILVLFSLFQPR